MPERILVIRLGALGDLVLCFQAFQSIRDAHPDAEIALLTMPAFAGFAKQMPWFDHVFIDPRAPGWRVDAWLKLARTVRAFAPARVYDLQGKCRQSVLFYLSGKPEWSGAAGGCSHPRLWPPEKDMHFTDFVAAQLKRAGIKIAEAIDLSWLDASLNQFTLPERFALLIPGCAPGRTYKRWPAAHYAALAAALREKGIESVAVGTAHDRAAIREIVQKAPHVADLSGQTSLPQVAALARRAEWVIGNDTGPTHLAAAVGAKTLALMSERVDPQWSVPRGPKATWLQGNPLATLGVEEVLRQIPTLRRAIL